MGYTSSVFFLLKRCRLKLLISLNAPYTGPIQEEYFSRNLFEHIDIYTIFSIIINLVY